MELKNINKFTVVLFRPDMKAVVCSDEL